MVVETKGNKIEQLEIQEEQKKELIKKREELIAETFFSPREAEIYILYKIKDGEPETLKELADMLDISKNTIYQHWSNCKDKISKAERTTYLQATL